jgi:hypothetical protein
MPVIRPKIPISLSIVSYIFFVGGLLGAIGGCAGMAVAQTDFPPASFMLLILGILDLFAWRGLRRCSRGWHIYALLAISVSLVSTVYGTAYYIFHYHYPLRGAGASPFVFLIGRFVASCLEIWTLRVLTRADVRFLFYAADR